jgi:distribution and morphology protein 34
MFLRLSSFHLSGIIILVFSKQKGLTLVFRNDPIESLNVSSTFDSIPSIQRFLQAEIERLLRDLMQEQVPAIIHKLSLEWAMRHQADECLSPASFTNTLQSEEQASSVSYPFSLDVDETDDVLRPKFSSVSLARLGELEGAQRTLSPFTAAIPQSVFRSSVGLIAALRPRRRDFPFIKTSVDTGCATFPGPVEISPPESVLSAQSNVSRPSLFNTRQRPSYLRRPRHPKRKVIRLGESAPSTSVQDHQSVGQSETSEDGADYYSEPDGYQSSYQRECESKWMKEAVLREALWSGTYPKAWQGTAKNDLENGGENPWTGDSRFTGSRDKGGL